MNEPAFPTMGRFIETDGTKLQEASSAGMTLRDYFAAQAMAIAFQTEGLIPESDIADVAYRIADAMVERRKYQ